MSVQTELNRLNTAKSDIVTAITNKGVTVPSSTKLDGMASLIDGISAGGFPNGTEWTKSGYTKSAASLCYGNGVWVLTGSGIYYSTDGKNWTASNVTSGSNGCCHFANGLWVASVGSNGLYYSTDGKTWTRSNITSYKFYSVNYANGLWIACSHNYGGIYSSADGKSWVARKGSTNAKVSCYANGLWVVGGTDGSWYGATSLYYSSDDGMTWSSMNIGTDDVAAICYANGLWVAGGGTGVSGSEMISLGLFYSTNGTSWTQSNIMGGWFESIYNANGLWVAGGQRGIYYSTDGKNWTQSNITTSVHSICNACGIWVAGSSYIDYSTGNGIHYSVDGKTWARSDTTVGTFLKVLNENGIWVGASSSGVSYSVTWEPS